MLSVLYKGGLLMGSAHMTVGELSSFLMYAFWVGLSIGGISHEQALSVHTENQAPLDGRSQCAIPLAKMKFWGWVSGFPLGSGLLVSFQSSGPWGSCVFQPFHVMECVSQNPGERRVAGGSGWRPWACLVRTAPHTFCCPES